MRRPAGLTLIELLIALAIAGVLSLAAIQAWSGHHARAQRAAAHAALVAAMAELEHHHAHTGSYADPADTASPAGRWPRPAQHPPDYRLTALPCEGRPLTQCVEVSAQPARADAACGTLILRSTGERFIQTADTREPAPPACWP